MLGTGLFVGTPPTVERTIHAGHWLKLGVQGAKIFWAVYAAASASVNCLASGARAERRAGSRRLVLGEPCVRKLVLLHGSPAYRGVVLFSMVRFSTKTSLAVILTVKPSLVPVALRQKRLCGLAGLAVKGDEGLVDGELLRSAPHPSKCGTSSKGSTH